MCAEAVLIRPRTAGVSLMDITVLYSHVALVSGGSGRASGRGGPLWWMRKAAATQRISAKLLSSCNHSLQPLQGQDHPVLVGGCKCHTFQPVCGRDGGASCSVGVLFMKSCGRWAALQGLARTWNSTGPCKNCGSYASV